MAIPTTELSDSFDQWRQNTNTNASNIGDVATLTTTATNLTDAVNEATQIGQVISDNSIAMAIALGG